MIDLQQYGFTKTTEAERWTEYQGHEFIVIIYNYLVTTFEKKEVAHNVFVVSSKSFTSRARHITELEQWLEEKKISKTPA